jgi:hypothetical protein
MFVARPSVNHNGLYVMKVAVEACAVVSKRLEAHSSDFVDGTGLRQRDDYERPRQEGTL